MAKAIVKCLICGKDFDRNSEPCTKIGRRYAHLACTQTSAKQVQEKQDEVEFWKTVKKIYGENYNYYLINTQVLNLFKDHPEYTYSGMTKCLKYFFEIQKNSIEDGHGGVGIIPYIYKEVKDYYYKIYITKNKNKNKHIILKPNELFIQSPRVYNQEPLKLMDIDEEECDDIDGQ